MEYLKKSKFNVEKWGLKRKERNKGGWEDNQGLDSAAF